MDFQRVWHVHQNFPLSQPTISNQSECVPDAEVVLRFNMCCGVLQALMFFTSIVDHCKHTGMHTYQFVKFLTCSKSCFSICLSLSRRTLKYKPCSHTFQPAPNSYRMLGVLRS